MTPQPILFADQIETIEPDEAETAASILRSMQSIARKTFKDGGRALRPVHAKSHLLTQGTFEVLDGLPPSLAKGLFATPATYPVIMRVSTIAGDMMPDSVSLPRGLVLKVLDVAGEQLPGPEGETSQDFLMVNGSTFGSPDAKALARTLRLLAPTTDRVEAMKRAFSALAKGARWALAHVGAESATLAGLGGHPETHPLGETYCAEVPFRYGDYIAKFSIAPLSDALRALAGAPLDVTGRPNGLREGINAFFAEQGGTWEFCVQLCTDLKTMPIEDASVAWSEDHSPFIAVARITMDKQPAWTEDRSSVVDDGMSFRPWNGIASHRPLGGVMRVRKIVYQQTVEFRSEQRGCPIREPGARSTLPG